MGSTKKLDLAKELVDFLSSQDGDKTMQVKDNKDKATPIQMESVKPISLKEEPQQSSDFPALTVVSNKAPEPNKETVTEEKVMRPQTSYVALPSSIAGQAHALQLAQNQIKNLEGERDELRDQLEKLLVSVDSLQRRLAETKTQLENSKRNANERAEIMLEEKMVLSGQLKAREGELNEIKKENEDLKTSFQTDLRRVRTRERELENRIELIKADQAALFKAKDELIIEIKREKEQLEYELENYRLRTTELNADLGDHLDRNHRLVKTLRLALSMLDTLEEEQRKKVTG